MKFLCFRYYKQGKWEQLETRLPILSQYRVLERIGGKKFTRRQIDVIAAVVSGEALAHSSKDIAALLLNENHRSPRPNAIVEKAVETHIRNIADKVSDSDEAHYNSRRIIKEYVGKAAEYTALKKHAAFILREFIFRKYTRDLNLSFKSILFLKDESMRDDFLGEEVFSLLSGYIEWAHNTYIQIETFNFKRFSEGHLSPSVDKSELIFCIRQPIGEREEVEEKIIEQISRLQKCWVFVTLQEASSGSLLREKERPECLVGILTLLSHLYNEPMLLEKASMCTINQESSLDESEERSFGTQIISKTLLQPARKANIFFIPLVSAALLGSGWILLHKEKVEATVSNLYLIPNDRLLIRDEELDRINQMFTSHEDPEQNPVISVVGIGGSGKTTLSRTYGKRKRPHLSWELNARSKESLEESIETLASTVGDVDTLSQKEYEHISKGFEGRERLQKLINFIKRYLKKHPGWILIFDDLQEDYGNIQKYLPLDKNICGEGKIIVTTRNANIKIALDDKVLEIRPLTDQEKHGLFKKISGNRKSNTADELTSVIKQLPPFPLDVSVAAYQVGRGAIGADEYLEQLKNIEEEKETVKTHKDLLKLVGDYTDTRQNILLLAIQEIIGAKKEFGAILFFAALVNFNDIPRGFLEDRYGKAVVDDLVSRLAAHSFLTDVSVKNGVKVFSIHESVQEYLFLHLGSFYSKTTQRDLAKKEVFEAFREILEEKPGEKYTISFPLIRVILSHCDAALKHPEFFEKKDLIVLKTFMGVRYHLMGEFTKSEKLLLEALEEGEKINDPLVVSNLFRSLGSLYTYLARAQEAKSYLKKSLELAQQYHLKDDHKFCKGLAFLGFAHKIGGEYDMAVQYATQSLKVAERMKNPSLISYAKTFLGFFYNAQENYVAAEKVLKEAQQTFSALKDRSRWAWAGGHLGQTLIFTGRYQEAHKVLKQSYKIYKDVYGKTFSNTGWIQGLLGLSYAFLHDFNRAHKYLNRAHTISQTLFGEKSCETEKAISYKGILSFLEGKKDEAKQYFETARRVLIQNKHPIPKYLGEYLEKSKK